MSVLPEVPEADAAPDVAAIYAGLREAMGLPLVNLIWRHFATLPGVLPWAWEATRGVLGSDTVAAGSARMAELVRAAPGPGLHALGPALRAMPPDERTLIAAVVRAYNRGNTVNAQVLAAVRRSIASDEVPMRTAALPEAGGRGGGPVAAIPPLPRMDALPGPERAEVAALAALHDPQDAVVPSLYRHLALWPRVLPPLRQALAPMFAEGRIAALRAALLDASEASATLLLPRLSPPGPFPSEHRDAVLRVLALFPGKIIVEMAGIGLLLEAELDQVG